MAKYGADYLKRLFAAVERFEQAFNHWMETQVESDHLSSRGLHPTVRVKTGQDQAVERKLELDVAETAGAAARAVAITGASIGVAGIGTVDPIANWSLMSSPKALFTPQEVRTTAATVRGRLSTMIDEAEAETEFALPGFAPSQLHPIIWTAAAAHWTTHQYRVAVREASEALTLHWKTVLGRHDSNDTPFWQETLSPGDPKPGKPKLVWPGDPTTKTCKSMRGGLEPLGKALTNLATGLNLTVRNVTTHTRDELTEQEGMERLAAYSYFARLLEKCEIHRVGDGPSSA
ncbi:TIGR02391 family protein [Streptomyces sp. ST2-7A]|uniref:TIGR02391 family protein n=1 Tax=Streptomyces sp. ST2-7A TaxID=2907214 RepID=UPI001F3DCCF8|nr:TIGR02391 family protein [Streptomyces sp. ST2-7A]MCE7080425.1 TIGR02391 family protein [Streptomyces sp. ST2-7A]